MLAQKRVNWFIFLAAAALAVIFCTISLQYGHSVQFHFLNTIFENVPLSPEEEKFVSIFDDLLFLENISSPNELVFATEHQFAPIIFGKINLLLINYSHPNGYIKFTSTNETRAIQRIETTKVIWNGRIIKVPEDGALFKRRWTNGRFLECLRMNVSNGTRVIEESYVEKLAKFRDFFENRGSTVFLFGGTLLGWYRECSFIRDTTDVDFAMKIEWLSSKIINDLRRSREFKLYWILGKVNDSMELSVYSNKVKIDLFFLYREQDSDWVGGMKVSERMKLRWTYPRIDEFCAGDLLGQLFTVPCNVEKVLEADYGKNWMVPHNSTNFVWYSSHKNVREAGRWSEAEWKDVYRLF